MVPRKKITVEELIQRATRGRQFDRHKLFRPSLSYYLLKDPFWLWCEHHAPKDEAVDETTRYEELRMQRGVEYAYHWTDFEIHQMRRVIGRWPRLAKLAQIILNCVDLKEAIQAAVYLPVPTFSIKSVAPALGFRWRQKDVGAYQSMVCYWDYLDNTDLFEHRPGVDLQRGRLPRHVACGSGAANQIAIPARGLMRTIHPTHWASGRPAGHRYFASGRVDLASDPMI
jgi:RNase H-like protein